MSLRNADLIEVPVFANVHESELPILFPPVEFLNPEQIKGRGFNCDRPDRLIYVVLKDGEVRVSSEWSMIIPLRPEQIAQYNKYNSFVTPYKNPNYVISNYSDNIVYFDSQNKPKHFRVRISHPGLASGQPVIAAGEMYIWRGKIATGHPSGLNGINRASWNYRTTGEHLEKVVETSLSQFGLNAKGQFINSGLRSQPLPKIKEYHLFQIPKYSKPSGRPVTPGLGLNRLATKTVLGLVGLKLLNTTLTAVEIHAESNHFADENLGPPVSNPILSAAQLQLLKSGVDHAIKKIARISAAAPAILSLLGDLPDVKENYDRAVSQLPIQAEPRKELTSLEKLNNIILYEHPYGRDFGLTGVSPELLAILDHPEALEAYCLQQVGQFINKGYDYLRMGVRSIGAIPDVRNQFIDTINQIASGVWLASREYTDQEILNNIFLYDTPFGADFGVNGISAEQLAVLNHPEVLEAYPLQLLGQRIYQTIGALIDICRWSNRAGCKVNVVSAEDEEVKQQESAEPATTEPATTEAPDVDEETNTHSNETSENRPNFSDNIRLHELRGARVDNYPNSEVNSFLNYLSKKYNIQSVDVGQTVDGGNGVRLHLNNGATVSLGFKQDQNGMAVAVGASVPFAAPGFVTSMLGASWAALPLAAIGYGLYELAHYVNGKPTRLRHHATRMDNAYDEFKNILKPEKETKEKLYYEDKMSLDEYIKYMGEVDKSLKVLKEKAKRYAEDEARYGRWDDHSEEREDSYQNIQNEMRSHQAQNKEDILRAKSYDRVKQMAAAKCATLSIGAIHHRLNELWNKSNPSLDERTEYNYLLSVTKNKNLVQGSMAEFEAYQSIFDMTPMIVRENNLEIPDINLENCTSFREEFKTLYKKVKPSDEHPDGLKNNQAQRRAKEKGVELQQTYQDYRKAVRELKSWQQIKALKDAFDTKAKECLDYWATVPLKNGHFLFEADKGEFYFRGSSLALHVKDMMLSVATSSKLLQDTANIEKMTDAEKRERLGAFLLASANKQRSVLQQADLDNEAGQDAFEELYRATLLLHNDHYEVDDANKIANRHFLKLYEDSDGSFDQFRQIQSLMAFIESNQFANARAALGQIKNEYTRAEFQQATLIQMTSFLNELLNDSSVTVGQKSFQIAYDVLQQFAQEWNNVRDQAGNRNLLACAENLATRASKLHQAHFDQLENAGRHQRIIAMDLADASMTHENLRVNEHVAYLQSLLQTHQLQNALLKLSAQNADAPLKERHHENNKEIIINTRLLKDKVTSHASASARREHFHYCLTQLGLDLLSLTGSDVWLAGILGFNPDDIEANKNGLRRIAGSAISFFVEQSQSAIRRADLLAKSELLQLVASNPEDKEIFAGFIDASGNCNTNQIAEFFKQHGETIAGLRVAEAVCNFALKNSYDHSPEKAQEVSFDDWVKNEWLTWLLQKAESLLATTLNTAATVNSGNQFWLCLNGAETNALQLADGVGNMLVNAPLLASFLVDTLTPDQHCTTDPYRVFLSCFVQNVNTSMLTKFTNQNAGAILTILKKTLSLGGEFTATFISEALIPYHNAIITTINLLNYAIQIGFIYANGQYQEELLKRKVHNFQADIFALTKKMRDSAADQNRLKELRISAAHLFNCFKNTIVDYRVQYPELRRCYSEAVFYASYYADQVMIARAASTQDMHGLYMAIAEYVQLSAEELERIVKAQWNATARQGQIEDDAFIIQTLAQHFNRPILVYVLTNGSGQFDYKAQGLESGAAFKTGEPIFVVFDNGVNKTYRSCSVRGEYYFENTRELKRQEKMPQEVEAIRAKEADIVLIKNEIVATSARFFNQGIRMQVGQEGRVSFSMVNQYR